MQQGQLIGNVGCTGLCTGSHLDYRLKRNGTWVNPLVEHKKLPPGEPVPRPPSRPVRSHARRRARALHLRAVGRDR